MHTAGCCSGEGEGWSALSCTMGATGSIVLERIVDVIVNENSSICACRYSCRPIGCRPIEAMSWIGVSHLCFLVATGTSHRHSPPPAHLRQRGQSRRSVGVDLLVLLLPRPKAEPGTNQPASPSRVKFALHQCRPARSVASVQRARGVRGRSAIGRQKGQME